MYSNPAPLTDWQLSEAAEALASVRVPATPNTQRAYAAALRYWSAWFALRYGQRITLPVNPTAVIDFLQDHLAQNPNRDPAAANPYRGPLGASQHALPDAIDAQLVRQGYKGRPGPLPISTVMSRLSALSKAHKEQAIRFTEHAPPNPLADSAVREHLKRCRALASRVPRARRTSTPLNMDALGSLLATCDSDLAGVRDRALLLLAWHTGGRKRSELAGAEIQQFLVRDGRAYFELKTRWSPGRRLPDPDGLLTLKPLPKEPAAALKAWLAILTAQGVTHGALFRAVRYERVGEPLTGDGIRQILKRRAQLANLDVKRISPSSLRSGFVRNAIEQDRPLQDIMALAGYRHVPRVLP
jgi:integrase